jgi:hypothetical protein
MDILDPALLQDVGGWAVVVLVVRWMMTRMDADRASSNRHFEALITEFKEWRVQEAEQHRSLERTQAEILSRIPPRT